MQQQRMTAGLESPPVGIVSHCTMHTNVRENALSPYPC
jgi:hypothetical protein